MGRFSHLNQQSKDDERDQYWKTNKEAILSILQEVNDDVLDGKGSIEENSYRPDALYNPFPNWSRPNIVLTNGFRKLKVCVYSKYDHTLGVIVEYQGRYFQDEYANVSLLPSTIEYLIGIVFS